MSIKIDELKKAYAVISGTTADQNVVVEHIALSEKIAESVLAQIAEAKAFESLGISVEKFKEAVAKVKSGLRIRKLQVKVGDLPWTKRDEEKE